ncbi:MAG: putative Ig domain-containing protein, partial [Proteobacteria bacterium]|nr:putative Ig domain-containing protein [Pseudomonadota bacterium]
IFAATTATYFVAKASGVLPSWFWGSKPPEEGGLVDTAFSSQEIFSSLIQEMQPKVRVFSEGEDGADMSISPIAESFLTDFQEAELPLLPVIEALDTDKAVDSPGVKEAESISEEDSIVVDTAFSKSHQRRLLQQTSTVTVSNLIPDQFIEVSQLYEYSMNEVFSGEYTLLGVTQADGTSFPSWLNYNAIIEGHYTNGFQTTYPVLISGDLAFTTEQSSSTSWRLVILNISIPSTIQLIGSYPLESFGYNYGLQLLNSTLFVATYFTGLLILDVSTPSIPRFLGNCSQQVGARRILVSGNTVFIAGAIIDVSIPDRCQILSVYDSGVGSDFAILNSTLFIASGEFGFHILDISNLSAPRPLATYSTTAWRIVASEDMLFVAAGTAGLKIFNVSTPSAPRLVGVCDTPGNSLDLAIWGSKVFIADQNAGLQVIDVSAPGFPRLVSSYASFDVVDVTISQNRVFASVQTGGFQILDVSQGKLSATPPPSSLGQKVTLTVYAANATHILANTNFTLTVDQLPYVLETSFSDQTVFPDHHLVLRVSNSLFINPSHSYLRLSLRSQSSSLEWLTLSLLPSALLSSYDLPIIGFITDLVVLNNIAFMAHSYNSEGGFSIVDTSNPITPRLLSNYEVVSTFSSTYRVAVSDDTLYLAAGSDGIKFFDISVLNTPKFLNVISPGFLSSVSSVTVLNSTLFAFGDEGIVAYDVSNLNSWRLGPFFVVTSSGQPTHIGISGLPVFTGNKIFITYNLLFGQLYTSGLLILDSSLVLIGNYSYNSLGVFQAVVGVVVMDNTAYLSFSLSQTSTIQILDVSKPDTPHLLGNFSSSSWSGGATFFLSGNTLFIVTENLVSPNFVNSIQIWDVKEPRSPRLLSNANFPYTPTLGCLAVSDSTLFYTIGSQLQILDASRWQLTATPNISDVGNYAVQLLAIDVLGGSASVNFTLHVQGPPQINGMLFQQYAKIGQAFNYFVPQKLITDPNFDTISFSARVEGSASLPSWLNFNGISAIFAGVPQEENAGNFTVILSATDNIAGVLDTQFGLLVDHLPVVTQSIPAQVAGIGLFYNYTVPDNLFYEPDGYPMSYSAQQSNRLPLPSWLTFNSTTRQFKGQPNSTYRGTYSIAVIARDDYQGQTKTDFALVVENFPTVNQWLTAPVAGVGIPFSWEISSNTFVDLDNDLLTYAVRQQDGSLLPSWLSFNSRTLVFSGVPQSTDVRILPLQLSAQDPSGGQAQQNFNLTVAYFPEVKGIIPTQLADVDEFYQYTVAANTFGQADNTVLLYSAQQSSGLDLPSWLHFNKTTR